MVWSNGPLSGRGVAANGRARAEGFRCSPAATSRPLAWHPFPRFSPSAFADALSTVPRRCDFTSILLVSVSCPQTLPMWTPPARFRGQENGASVASSSCRLPAGRGPPDWPSAGREVNPGAHPLQRLLLLSPNTGRREAEKGVRGGTRPRYFTSGETENVTGDP